MTIKKEHPLASRLAQERKSDFDTLAKILQYHDESKGRVPPWAFPWVFRIGRLDGHCASLYVAGLLDYQGKGFMEIFRGEKKAGRLRQPHTLDSRLKLLMAQDLVVKKPHARGPGRRGKYYFFQPSEVQDLDKKLKKGELENNPVVTYVRYLQAPPTSKDPSIKAKELARKLELLHLEIGLMFTHEMEFLSYIKNRGNLLKSALFETRLLSLDISVNSAILAQNYRDVVLEGLRIFYTRLEEKYGIKVPRIH